MKKVLIGTLAVSLSLGVAVAEEKKPAAPSGNTPATTASADPVVISFGDTKIKKSEFEAAIKTLPAEYQQMANGPAKKQFAEEYVRMKMLSVQGMKEGVQNDPDVVAQLSLLRENTIANAELAKIQGAIKVSDADLQKAYDEQKSTFEHVKAQHILIAFKGSKAAQPGKPELTDEQAKAKAEDLRKKIVAGGDFAELAKKESDDTVSGQRGGDLGEFGRGDMVPEFEKTAFETKAGEVSPIVRTEYGYHIIKVQEHVQTPVAEARPQLEGKLKQELLQKKLDEMKGSLNVSYDASYFPAPALPPATGANQAPKSDAPVKQ